ncbi:hypothetical protein V1511DRAFT_504482 [Dipodascopsis uninucleata]
MSLMLCKRLLWNHTRPAASRVKTCWLQCTNIRKCNDMMLTASSSYSKRQVRMLSTGNERNIDVAEDSKPWYLRTELQTSQVTNLEPLPDLPDGAPEELTAIMKFLAQDLGMTELLIVDVRNIQGAVDRGATMMVLCTARSERHIARAAEELRVFLKRTFRVKIKVEGQTTKESLKTQERRMKKKLSKFAGDTRISESQAREINHSSWVCFDTCVKGVQIHMITGEKRWELDLEGLWQDEIPRLEKVLSHSEKENLSDAMLSTKRRFKRIGLRPKYKDGLVDPRTETEEFKTFNLDRGRVRTPNTLSANRDAGISDIFYVPKRQFHYSRNASTAVLSDINANIVDSAKNILDHLTAKQNALDTTLSTQQNNEIMSVMNQLSDEGEYELVCKLGKLIISTTQQGDDSSYVYSLMLLAHTNFLRLKPEDAEKALPISAEESSQFLASFYRAFPLESTQSGHWRHRLEFLAESHRLKHEAVPVRQLTDSLVQQRLAGNSVTKEDFQLVLDTIVDSEEFGRRYGETNRRIWTETTRTRFKEIIYLFRAVGRHIENREFKELMRNSSVMTQLYRACMQPVKSVEDIIREPVPRADWNLAVDNRRTGAIDKIMIRDCIEISPEYFALSMMAHSQAKRWPLFWKRWEDLYYSGVQRDLKLWSFIASLVSISGDVQQMTRFLSKSWDLCCADLEQQYGRDVFYNLPDELVRSLNVCLDVVDPYGRQYEYIRKTIERRE